MNYEIFIMKDCDKCHHIVHRLTEKGANFTQYDLTGGVRDERIKGKKLLASYMQPLGLEKVDGLVDIPVLLAYDGEKPVDLSATKKDGKLTVLQGKAAVEGIDALL